jgi:hypothetical protein
MTTVDRLKAAALRQIAALDREYSDFKTKLRHAEFGAVVQPDEYAEFNTRCLALIDRTLGRGHAYYEQALREVQRESMTSAELAASLHGLVRALKVDVAADALATVRETGHADLLAVFLHMAEGLLGAQRKGPAAVLLGGALEAHLRNLAVKHHVEMADEGRASSAPLAQELNELLAQQVYGLTEFKSVAAWLELREKASRSTSSAYSQGDVAKFLCGLRAFIAGFPA